RKGISLSNEGCSLHEGGTMNIGVSIGRAVLGGAFALALSQCGGEAGGKAPTNSTTEAITNQWANFNLNAYHQGDLDRQEGYSRLQPGDNSPNVVGPIDDGSYHHFNVVKMPNKSPSFSSAQHDVNPPTRAQGKQVCVFQARVNDVVS